MNGEFYAGCSELTKVVDGFNTTGYPWTDRLLGDTYNVDSTVNGLDGLPITASPAPFGFSSFQPEIDEESALEDNWPHVVASCVDAGTNVLHQPYDVTAANVNLCNTESQVDYSDGGSAAGEDPSDPLKNRLMPSSAEVMIRSLVDFTYGTYDLIDQVTRRSSLSDFSVVNPNPYDVLLQLFAGTKLNGIGGSEFFWNREETAWPDIDRRYVAADPEEENDVRATEGNPPEVFSLRSGTCVGTACEEGDLNTLTLNDQNSGDVIGSDFVRAYLKFYAAANENQLPIRRVIVDWGDEADRTDSMQGSSSADNLYKNHRGLDSGTDQSICDRDNEWGETPDSCDPNYFSYSHVYSCSAEILQGDTCQYNSEGKLLNSPCWEDGGGEGQAEDYVCVFQPRVHVRDNWGWCTGTCVNDPSRNINEDGTEGCFEGDVDTLNEGNIDNLFSECAYESPLNTVGGPIDPWVYYGGTVVVDPL
jgi:hypothetical protein